MEQPKSPIRLFIFTGVWGLPSTSPFCIKLDAWLRMSGLPYEVVNVPTAHAGPKKKAPWIEDEGVRLGDSTLIIKSLSKKYGIDLDRGLSELQLAQAQALQGMLEERTYQVMMYTHFVWDEGWASARDLLVDAPRPAWPLIGFIMRRQIRKDLNFRGMGRHSHEEIMEFGKRDLQVLSTVLGDQAYFFGDVPTSFDACAYGFLAMFLRCPVASEVQKVGKRMNNLIEFLDRFEARFHQRTLTSPPTEKSLAA
jgi:glutathione S-transferase